MTTSPTTAPVDERVDEPADQLRVDRDLLLGLVADIAGVLEADALWCGSECLWLGDEVVELEGEFPVLHHALGGSLYSGSAGIGWFLAHAATALDDPALAATASAGLRHGLAWVRGADSISLHAGTAGVGLACLDAGRVLGDDELVSDAVAVLVDAARRATERTDVTTRQGAGSDLISGDAGVVLALLGGAQTVDRSSMAAEGAAATLRAAAVTVGDRLVADADRGPTGWTWPPLDADEPPLCGLGHGASGPALALAELFAVTSEERFAEAAREACRSERAWFANGAGGWPDLREFSRLDLAEGITPTYPHLWCHGSVGIGVARLQIWGATGDVAALADASAALHHARAALAALGRAMPGEYAANFSLCHGAAGLIDLLRLADDVLGDRSWRSAAAAAVGVGLRHLVATDTWRCGVEAGPHPTSTPGLMLGLAGTGAALLRLADVVPMVSPLLLVEHRSRRIEPDRPSVWETREAT